MAFCRSVYILSVLYLLNSVIATRVPVLIVGDLPTKSAKANPLTTISQLEFDGILDGEILDDQFDVVFIEENLSVEDLSLKNSEGETSFPFFASNLDKLVYLPSVESPVQELNLLADRADANHVRLTENGLSTEIGSEDGKFLLVNLNDAKDGESRADMLRRHNDFMEETYNKLKEQYGKVIMIYTGQYPSFIIPDSHLRVRRQTEKQSKAMLDLNGVLLDVGDIVVFDGSKITSLGPMTSHNIQENDTQLIADITFGNAHVNMFFDHDGSYWYFIKVDYKTDTTAEELYPASDVYVLDGFSYSCGEGLSFYSGNANKSFSLTFQNVQLQPYAYNMTEFDEPIDCVGYVTVPILSGLFVVFIMLAITFYGIIMMMDIRTMDRFDDPKGKTITINAAAD